LQDAEGHTLLGYLAALSELSRFAPDTFEEHSDVVVKFLLHDVLVAPPPRKGDEDMEVDKAEEDDEDVWCDEDQLEPEIGSKLFVLRLLTNRCIVNSDTEGAMMVAQPVAKMLFNILENDGSFEVSSDKRQAYVHRRLVFAQADQLIVVGPLHDPSCACALPPPFSSSPPLRNTTVSSNHNFHSSPPSCRFVGSTGTQTAD
jgi:sister-chromatid-cohesion protein PDS5